MASTSVSKKVSETKKKKRRCKKMKKMDWNLIGAVCSWVKWWRNLLCVKFRKTNYKEVIK